MFTTFNDHIKTLSGKCPDGKHVFAAIRDGELCVKRVYTKPIITSHNIATGAKFSAVTALYPQTGPQFKYALNLYAKAYNRQYQPLNKGYIYGYNVFIMALMNSQVDIADLDSIASVVSCYGSTIQNWITAGLLKPVKYAISNANIST